MRAGVQVPLIAAAQVMSLTCWFSLTAVAPALQAETGLSGPAAVLLTSSVQIGFACGAVLSAVLGAADRVPAPVLYVAASTTAAACTGALVLVGDSPAALLALRFATGASLAGVYPVGMRLVASWTTPRRRGIALGTLVGALTIGSAMPYAIRGTTTLPWRDVVLAAALVTLAGASLTAALVRSGPHLGRERAPFRPGYALAMFRTPDARRANLGYFGHVWELYALWTWLPLYLATHDALDPPGAFVLAFVAIGVAGALGCLVGGLASDRVGRAPAAGTALAISGLCCLLSPWMVLVPLALTVAFTLLWGAAVVADSAVFSAALSESVDPRYVGTALTVQTALGYLVTAAAIHVVGAVGQATSWSTALALLALGPAFGLPAIARYGRERRLVDR